MNSAMKKTVIALVVLMSFAGVSCRHNDAGPSCREFSAVKCNVDALLAS